MDPPDSGAPAGGAAPGVFFYGQNQVQVPSGDGFVCVGSPSIRLNPPAFTNGLGSASRTLDFTSAPLNGGLGHVTPGLTWNFQYWIRDPGGPGGTGHNLTDGVAVVFCP